MYCNLVRRACELNPESWSEWSLQRSLLWGSYFHGLQVECVFVQCKGFYKHLQKRCKLVWKLSKYESNVSQNKKQQFVKFFKFQILSCLQQEKWTKVQETVISKKTWDVDVHDHGLYSIFSQTQRRSYPSHSFAIALNHLDMLHDRSYFLFVTGSYCITSFLNTLLQFTSCILSVLQVLSHSSRLSSFSSKRE